MNKYLNKLYEEDLTEIERMSMHQPKTFDSTYASKKIRNWNKKPKKIKTTREEAQFFGEEPSKPARKRTKRAQQEHDLLKDMARPVQRKDPRYKNAAEVGIDKAKQKRAQPGKDWNEVVAQPAKKIRMIVAENEIPRPSSSKSSALKISSKKPPLKTKLQKPRPKSKTRKESQGDSRPSKSDQKHSKKSDEKIIQKPKKSVPEVQKPNSADVQVPSDPRKKRLSKIEEFRLLLAEQKLNSEPEHVREPSKCSVEPIPEPSVQQCSVLDDLGSRSSQESSPSEAESERQACESSSESELEPQKLSEWKSWMISLKKLLKYQTMMLKSSSHPARR